MQKGNVLPMRPLGKTGVEVTILAAFALAPVYGVTHARKQESANHRCWNALGGRHGIRLDCSQF